MPSCPSAALDAGHDLRHRLELHRGVIGHVEANSSSSANRMLRPSSESMPELLERAGLGDAAVRAVLRSALMTRMTGPRRCLAWDDGLLPLQQEQFRTESGPIAAITL
jgi:hypothetical protein